jgi:RNA polymerase sigma factor (TIGR02999 family)
MPPPGGEVTLLLTELRAGNQEAANRLMPLIYSELRRMAGSYMQRERVSHTLQATALVNEVYMRLAGGDPIPWQNRAHFFGVAARAMREVLLDYARCHIAGKRGGKEAQKVEIDVELPGVSPKIENVIAIDEALERLERIDPRQSRLIELRFFAGLSVDEAAEVMGVSPTTIKRDWRSAKAWLHRELASGRSE